MVNSVLDTQHGGSHYKGKAIQPIEYAHANNLSFFQGNVVKYVTRYKDKKGAEDIEKAIHYLQMILEFEYGMKTSFKKEEDISEQECVDYHQKLWKEVTTQPQSQVEQEKPWYPPVEDGGNPWIECVKSGMPVAGKSFVQVLDISERLKQEWLDTTKYVAEDIGWCAEDGIVAYRVVESHKRKLWCETCEGVGHYDNRDFGVPREYRNSECPCPDCDGKGYFEV